MGAGEAPYGIGEPPAAVGAAGNVDVVRCVRGSVVRFVSVRLAPGCDDPPNEAEAVDDSTGKMRAPSSISVRTKEACAPANGLSGNTPELASPVCAETVGSVMNRETRLTDSRSCCCLVASFPENAGRDPTVGNCAAFCATEWADNLPVVRVVDSRPEESAMGPVNDAFRREAVAAFGRPAGNLAFEDVGLAGRPCTPGDSPEKAQAPRAISPLTTGGAAASLRLGAAVAAVGDDSG